MSDVLSKAEGSAIRTFIAIELPDDVRRRLALLQARLPEFDGDVKWVREDLLHLTLGFLGNLSAARVGAAEAAARTAAQSAQPFYLRVSGWGAFPNVSAPRVLWAGLAEDDGMGALRRLHGALMGALWSAGFSPESRPFSPHITLGRTRDSVSGGTRRELGARFVSLRAQIVLDAPCAVQELVVMRSDLARSGPAYTPMSVAPLGGTGRT